MQQEENTFQPKCFRCGHDLMITGNDEYGENESNRFYYTCPNCGDEYEEYELEDEEKYNFNYWKDK